MSVMKRDFIGKTVFLVAFVAILVVSVYGISGKMMQERHDAQNKTSETTSDKQTDNNDLKTTEETTEKTTEAEEKGEWKLPKATDKLVCFTFDDGPYADTYSDEIIRASKMGCEIGTHTYSHVNLNSLSVPEMQEEIKKSCDAISKYTGKKVKVLRPPEGAADDTVKANVGMPMVLWSVDSRDWDYRNADKDYQTVMDNVFDGSIVLMHDLYPATADAVARLIPELAKQGYKFVTFSELMKIRGVDVDPGEKYFSATPQTPAEECDNAG